VVPELREVGVSDYREILWKPYRILYFVEDKRVYVVAILDGRRDLVDLLVQRLLR
jgi:toxin ParE1/3/4